MENEKEYPMCFACGRENPISLKLDFSLDGEKGVIAEFYPEINHQGYIGIMHGGLVTTLLDEAMVKAVGSLGIEAVTAEIKVRFKQPVPIQEKVIIRGAVTKKKSRLIFAEAMVKNINGETMALAEGRFMAVRK